MTHERKTIAVNKENAEKLAEIAKNEGMTLFSLINEILETAIFAHETKLGKLSDLIKNYQDLMLAKDLGMVLVPLKLENLVNKLAFQTDGWDELLTNWYQYGKWIANYTRVRFPQDRLKIFENVNKTLYWTNTEFEIKYIPNDEDPDKIQLRVFGQELEVEYLECIVSTYEGIFHEFKYKTTKKEISQGICSLNLQKIY